MATIQFFGYGANRNKLRLQEIIGHNLAPGVGAIVTGYQLAIQTLPDIPASACSMLQDVWGPRFAAYSLRRGNGLVSGIVWQLAETDLAKMKLWEFDGKWRQFVPITVRTFANTTVEALTDIAPFEQPYTRTTDGLWYDDLLNPGSIFAKQIAADEKTQIASIMEKLTTLAQTEIERAPLQK